MEILDFLSSDSNDSDTHSHSVEDVDFYNSFAEDHISDIDPTTDIDNNDTLLPQINSEASYPKKIFPSIKSDRPGNVFEYQILKENWMIVNLVEERYQFVPPVVDKVNHKSTMTKF